MHGNVVNNNINVLVLSLALLDCEMRKKLSSAIKFVDSCHLFKGTGVDLSRVSVTHPNLELA